MTQYLVKWDDNEQTWETKEDLEKSEFSKILTDYNKKFTNSSIPMKIIGRCTVKGRENYLYVRWQDGNYEYVNSLDLLDKYPELFL